MRGIAIFAVGALAGGAAGAGVWLANRAPEAPALGAPADPHTDCRAREQALAARVAALEQVARAVPSPASASAPAATTVEGGAAPVPAPAAGSAADPGTPAAAPGAGAQGSPGVGGGGRGQRKPEDPAITRLKELGRTVANAAPDAPERAAALKELFEALRSPDPAHAEAAAEALFSVARRGSLTPDETALLSSEREALPAGHVARPALAGAVSAGWAKDSRLGPWLDGLATAPDSSSQVMALRALDKATSEPLRAFVLRLTNETKDPEVMDNLWDEDRMYAACTRENAARLAEAIDVRLQETAIRRETRGLGFYALALASVHDPAAVAPLLARRAASEKDPLVLALAQEMAKVVASGEANVATLEEVWDRLRKTLRDPKPAPAPAK